jgi:signal recognition particle receptor subunit beta
MREGIGTDAAHSAGGGGRSTVPFIDAKRNEIQTKLVYYGPGRSGKTTNLHQIHKSMPTHACGKMVTIDTKGDRTLFFDFLPISLGKIMNMTVRIQLYTVPGQVLYNETRKLVLRGVDGIIFVADSIRLQQKQNIDSLANLALNLNDEKLDLREIPLVFQYNKRDLGESNIPILSLQEMEYDLNRDLKVPAYEASAKQGYGIVEPLKEVTKQTIRRLIQRLGSQRSNAA